MKNVAFTRWDPLRDLLALHEQLGHLVGTDAPGWTPPAGLYGTGSALVLTAESPASSPPVGCVRRKHSARLMQRDRPWWNRPINNLARLRHCRLWRAPSTRARPRSLRAGPTSRVSRARRSKALRTSRRCR